MDFALKGLEFSARSVYCIGRNYAAHAKELGNPIAAEPVVFLKPASALVHSGGKITLPAVSHRVDHEVEVVLAVGRGGKNIPVAHALDHIAGAAIGVDVTARDLQDAAKKGALPWTVSKGFDSFAPVSDFLGLAAIGTLPWEFSLDVNGKRRQTGNTRDMVHSLAELVHYLSTIFTLGQGDLIFTGTPAGVAPLAKGDKLHAVLASKLKLDVTVA